ncbi:MAG: nicotinamide mononucleotide transporter [Bacteroidia bacterium]|nr:nicotinamide mononucleotide transporter [Bacteroidia bacterium]HQV00093.1 nicotinamide riboside transporter PnuC [Bacteroidia bacterium]
MISSLEFIGACFGVLGIWLTAKKNVLCFPVGIINVLITANVVFEVKLYADVVQQLMYLVLLVYGWINWTKSQNIKSVSYCTVTQKIFVVVITLIIGTVGYFILKKYTNATYPAADAYATAVCFAAQFLIAKRKIENWWLWLFANLVYVVIFYLKQMPWYAGLSVIYFLQAIFGLKQWHKQLKTI